ncbi:hypothetical protein AB6A23_20140 [Paenibacillus tarimensis]
MRRAVVIFLENQRDLMLQFGCLYLSLKYIQARDTDLVVFGPRDALSQVPDDCVKIVCPPLSHPPEWICYRYINSISCLVSEHSDVLEQYHYLLRSDVDTVLTPAWNAFYPELYTVGLGGYAHSLPVMKNLKRVARSLGLGHKGIHNIGSTHYGKPGVIRNVCRLAAQVTHHILTQEFKDSPGEWPGWYKGVSSLYGMEIATNHLVETMSPDRLKLDASCTSQQSILNYPHIHFWHTFDMFSKFDFTAGKYDHLTADHLDLSQIKNYCLYIALRSRKEMPWLG